MSNFDSVPFIIVLYQEAGDYLHPELAPTQTVDSIVIKGWKVLDPANPNVARRLKHRIMVCADGSLDIQSDTGVSIEPQSSNHFKVHFT